MVLVYSFIGLFLCMVILFFIFIHYKRMEIKALHEIKDKIDQLEIKPTISTLEKDVVFKNSDTYKTQEEECWLEDFEEVDENLILSKIHDMGKKDLKANFKRVGMIDSKDAGNIDDSVNKLKGISGNVENKK
jgi:hypothetical protein